LHSIYKICKVLEAYGILYSELKVEISQKTLTIL